MKADVYGRKKRPKWITAAQKEHFRSRVKARKDNVTLLLMGDDILLTKTHPLRASGDHLRPSASPDPTFATGTVLGWWDLNQTRSLLPRGHVNFLSI